MWEICIETSINNKDYILYIKNKMQNTISAVSGVISLFENTDICSIAIGCKKQDKSKVAGVLRFILCDVICEKMKYDYLSKNVGLVPQDSGYFSPFVKVLTYFDSELERQIVMRSLNLTPKIVLESFLNFKLRPLKVKWQDVSSIKDEIIESISNVLNDNYIFSTIKFRMKNLYGIYKSLMNGTSIDNIHDLFIFNILLDNVDNCYLALKYIHELYKPNTIFFKDYIAQPKPNHYEALHTTVFGPDDKLMQMQIRTPEMEQLARYGITYYWHQDIDNASIIMQDTFNKQYPLMQSILIANKNAKSNADFVQIVEEDVLGEKIPIYNNKGELIEIARGSTPIDYAYLNFSGVANHLAAVIVNGVAVNFDYTIQPYDKIRIITDINALGPDESWLEIAKTATAKQKIKEYLRRNTQRLTRSPW